LKPGALSSALTGAWAALASFLAGIARRSPPEVTTRELWIADLEADLDRYTVVVISDLHLPPTHDTRWLATIVATVNATSPDLVALLGDYGTSFKHMASVSRAWYETALTASVPVASRLQARDGIVAVLGNHDYYAGAHRVREWLGAIGADVLINRVRFIRRGNGVLKVAGVDDVCEGTIDPRVEALPGTPGPTLILSHNPDFVMHLSREVRADVVLAGHTHGGQVVLPWYGAPLTMSRVCGRRSASGWVKNERTTLYVTRGLGAQWPFPARVNCRSELLVLRLRAGQQPA